AEVDWSKAEVAVGISDVRAIQSTPSLTWAGEERAFLPGADACALAENGIHVGVPLGPGGRPIEFAFPLRLRGSEGVWFVPCARDTTVAVESAWPSRSFQGSWLPARREVSPAGFRAGWSIPYLGRNYAQAWSSEDLPAKAIEASRFGVRLVAPVDPHRMAQRSVKYGGLFILLTFAAIWLIEGLAQLRAHPIQYLPIGGALGLFFLLELSLAEHLGFALAYGAATAAVVGVVGAYARAVLGRPRRALAVAGMVAALYGYLYVLLTAEDFALLFGSL